MRNWFKVEAKADAPTEIAIYDEIGAWGVTAKDFIAELKKIDAKQITVNINSPGGSVFDALAIYNALRAHDASVTTKVMGVAASAASVIAMAGEKVVMPANTFLMVHNPLTFAYGNADEMRDMADVLDKIAASLIGIYVARTGLGEGEVKALLDAETWLNADDALAKGFATEIVDDLKIAASFDTDRLPENIKAVFAAASDEQTEDDADPAPKDESEQVADALADQISALAVAGGFGDLVAVWALNPEIKTVEDAKARIAEAREIRAVCVVANLADKAPGFIRAGKTLAEVRNELFTALADADESRPTNSFTKQDSKPSNSAQPTALKTADIWAARTNRKE